MRAPVVPGIFSSRALPKEGHANMSTSTIARPPTAATEDPRNGKLIGVAAYATAVFEPRRYGESRGTTGSGDPRYGITIIAHNPKLIAAMRESVTAAIKAVIDDQYPSAAKLPPRGLKGVKREPLIKLLSDYPKTWPDCPNSDAIFVRLGSYDPPLLVDQDAQALSPESAKLLIKSGSIVRVLYRAYHYDQGDPGIGLGLNCVQFLRPGYRLGRYVDTDALKESVDDELFADLDI
jgi:hypothetical protein